MGGLTSDHGSLLVSGDCVFIFPRRQFLPRSRCLHEILQIKIHIDFDGLLIVREHDNDVGLYFQLWIDLSHWALFSPCGKKNVDFTWHSAKSDQRRSEGVATEDRFVILEPAVRFGDADRWPCGIIFSLA